MNHDHAILHTPYTFASQVLRFAKMMRHKYNFDTFGDCACSQRFPKLLLGGTVALRSMDKGAVFITPLVKPWVHYVPINANASDVIEKIEFLRANDARAREIALSGQRFAKELFTRKGLSCYLLDLLTKYKALMDFEPIVTGEDTAVENTGQLNVSVRSLRGYSRIREEHRPLVHYKCAWR